MRSVNDRCEPRASSNANIRIGGPVAFARFYKNDGQTSESPPVGPSSVLSGAPA
jgi:hypothetical protein